jgi:hypothetical protein
MRDANVSFTIVTCYLIIGVLLMLASERIGRFLKRLGTKPVTYVRLSTFTFGACVSVLGAFGVFLHFVAL